MTREEAVEVLKERYLTCVGIGLDNHANRVNEAIDMAIEALSAEPEKIFCSPDAEWIPCGERLPSAEECPMDCMVTRKSKFVGNYVDMAVAEADGTWTHEDWKAITINGDATCISTRDADIIAWMPLPEPYREDDEE